MILNKDFSIIRQVENIAIKFYQLLLDPYNMNAILPITKFNNRQVILMRWHPWMVYVFKKYRNTTDYGLGYIFIKRGSNYIWKPNFKVWFLRSTFRKNVYSKTYRNLRHLTKYNYDKQRCLKLNLLRSLRSAYKKNFSETFLVEMAVIAVLYIT